MHPEIKAEQQYIDAAYGRLETVRQEAQEAAARVVRERIGRPMESLLERDALFGERLRRVAILSIGDEALIFGRIDLEDGSTLYIGRVGVTDEERNRLVVDWRSPAAEAFYRATPRDTMGVVRRRHFYCRGRELLAIDDELLEADSEYADDMVLVGEGALLRAMERSRTGRMGDIVATIQREQDEIIRAELPGVLVVHGGPGTGKTAVGLHRSSYLLYTHRRQLERTGVLFLGPTPVFLRYVQHVLPALGEQAVRMSTVSELMANVTPSKWDEPSAARVKGDPRMADVIRRAVGDRERGLTEPVRIYHDGEALELTPADTKRIAHEVRKARGSHNDKRGVLVKALMKHLIALYRSEVRRSVRAKSRGATPWGAGSMPHGARVDFFGEMLDAPIVREVLDEMWPALTPRQVVTDLYASRDRLRSAANGILSKDEWSALHRPEGEEWTHADVPVLDEAAVRLGTEVRKAKESQIDEEERWSIERMLDDLSEVEPLIGSMRTSLAEKYLNERRKLDDSPRRIAHRETFGHVVVDEAQDLSPMAWRMIGRRAPRRSMTIMGDLGQATSVWAVDEWDDALKHLGRHDWRLAELTINYRTPGEIMDAATEVLGDQATRLPRPRSVRRTGEPPVTQVVGRGQVVDAVVAGAEAEVARFEGTVAIVVPTALVAAVHERFPPSEDELEAPVAVLSVPDVKGLEFDAVVIGDPEAIMAESGRRGLYVAMTRPTKSLHILSVR